MHGTQGRTVTSKGCAHTRYYRTVRYRPTNGTIALAPPDGDKRNAPRTLQDCKTGFYTHP